jgi:hypothetical protein
LNEKQLENLPKRFRKLSIKDLDFIEMNNVQCLEKYFNIAEPSIKSSKEIYSYQFIEEHQKILEENLKVKIVLTEKGCHEFELSYPTKFISQRRISYVKEEVKRKNYFGNNDESIVRSLIKSTNFSRHTINSIRYTTMMQIYFDTKSIVDNNIYIFINRYNPDFSDKDIENAVYLFARVYSCNPVAVYDRIIELYKKEQKFRDFLHRRNMSTTTTNFLKNKLNKDDFSSFENQKMRRKQNRNYERLIINHLKDIGIAFQVRNEEKMGQSYSMPSIIFTSKVTINGRLIKWVEIKNFTCIGTGSFHNKSMKLYKQYKEKLGDGCIIFSGEISDSLVNQEFLYLSTSI